MENLSEKLPQSLSLTKPEGLEDAVQTAVCIPIIEGKDGPEILFEVRSSKMDSQPGDVCLPGGHREKGETPRETALRELKEELGYEEEKTRFLGYSDYLFTADLVICCCVIALSGLPVSLQREEVAECFTVPLRFFLENPPEVHTMRVNKTPEEGFPFEKIQGGKAYRFRSWKEKQLFYTYEGRVIWGYTARLIRAFVQRLM